MPHPRRELPPAPPAAASPRRTLYFAVLGLWLVIPVLVQGNLAQDALPFVVAGRLVGTEPDQIFATQADDLYDLKPAFAARSCSLAPAGTDCANLTVAFVSAPPALLFAVVLGWAGPTWGILLARLLAAASLAAGMAVLWRRLAGRHPDAPAFLLASVVLLTPFATVPVVLGQTSPYLFLAACLGVAHTTGDRTRAALTAALVVGCILLKVFPAVVLVVLVYQRRWSLLGWIVAVGAAIVAVGLVPVPPWLWGDFVTTARRLSGFSLTNPYNGSVDGVAHGLSPALTEGAAGALSVAIRVAAVAALFWWRVRRADDDTQWGFAWLASLLFVPLVWWHYLWLAVAALALAVAGRTRVDRRSLAVLPAVTAVSVPLTITDGAGAAASWARLLFLVGSVVAVAMLVDAPAGDRSQAATTGA